jgi:outer membrane biosynthesis protein TonB
MEPIQINVNVKLDDGTQAFLSSLFGGLAKSAGEQSKPAEQQKPAEQPKPKPAVAAPAKSTTVAPAKPAEQPKPAAAPAAAPAKPAEQPKPAVAPAPTVSTQSSVTIDGLRELAMTKMNAHRVEIKQKLTELGTPSITKLDVAKYQEMYDFLNGLE